MSFEDDLTRLINMHSIENESNTPDYILASYISRCLDAWVETTRARDVWFGSKSFVSKIEVEQSE